ISAEMIENSISKLNEYAREMDLLRKGKQGQIPGFKPVLFLIYNYIDVSYVPTTAYYDNKEKQQQSSLLDNRMLSADVREATLTEYYANTESRKQLLADVISFLDEYKKNPHRAQGLYISGEFGVGKTYLLGALANALDRKSTRLKSSHVSLSYADL